MSVAPAASGPRRSLLFVALSVLIAVVALCGFWPSYFGPLAGGRLKTEPILHLHAAVMVGWLVLLIAQTTLAARGRIEAHRAVGRLGIAWGMVLIAIGLLTAGVRSAAMAKKVSLDEAVAFLVFPALDMLLFALLFGAAVALRRRPAWHKRLMLAACTNLLIAPTGRMMPELEPTHGTLFLYDRPDLHLAWVALWLAPLLLGSIHDLLRRGRVHVVYVASLSLLLVSSFRDHLVGTAAWQGFARGVIAAFS